MLMPSIFNDSLFDDFFDFPSTVLIICLIIWYTPFLINSLTIDFAKFV